jgi:uncharacterized OsmC-like protein
MTITLKTKYLGELRTHSTHLKSGNEVITDAPIDNHGKGEAFSPTDLMCASLASCMFTIMGIVAKKLNVNIDNTESEVTKIMAENPRRVAEIVIIFNFPKNNFSESEKQALKDAAYSCPVALSLHPDLKKSVTFNF